MSTHIKEVDLDTKKSLRIWSVSDYCRQHQIGEAGERRMRQLFGHYASAGELRYNVNKNPRWRV
ncbi:hypothetical protein AS026_12445 [Rhizobium altiplani]|uniref:Uncharacterized protein n=1 Tax=Rhizobium altiplani TaxID=1864509 RepID=A0A125Q6G8_9HYPH|nr:hypothetical protein [Rhizobium altiplani]KWV47886.1 hypothetical protein AS026_12445 [Rhizobium altiplani]